MGHIARKHLRLINEKNGFRYVALSPFVRRYRDRLDLNRLDRKIRLVLGDVVQSDDGRLALVKNSKCACTAAAALIYEYSKGRPCGDVIHAQTGDFTQGIEHWRSHFRALSDTGVVKATFVRHPEDRIVSAFKNFVVDKRNNNAPMHLAAMRRFGYGESLDLERKVDLFLTYIEACIEADPLLTDRHFRAQVHNTAIDRIDYDLIARVEHFREGMLELFGRIGARDFIAAKATLERQNQSTPTPLHLSASQRLRVESLYSADYEAFCYPRRSTAEGLAHQRGITAEKASVGRPGWPLGPRYPTPISAA